YANSVLQALYFCQPFRDLVCVTPDGRPLPEIPIASLPPQVALPSPPPKDPVPATPAGATPAAAAAAAAASLPRLPQSIFSALRALFLHISLNTEDKGMVSPSAFIAALKKENPDFRTSQHQDAHEFLNYLLNRVAEDVDENRTSTLVHGASTDSSAAPTFASATPASSPPATPPRPAQRPLPSGRPTLIQSLFEGQLTNETRCLACNTVSHRDETFLDLSIDIEPNSSVTACLREFSKGEMLLEDNRFKCDHCNEYCDAEKRMKVKTLPNILALHLKRFKYIEDANRNIRPTKLTYRVAFPLELRLFDTSDDAQNPDRLYELFAIVVHIGAGLAHGHYVTVVRTQGKWVLFDDDAVDVIKESDIMKYFGDAPGGQAYVLFYQ
ncbi:cysteine proteinase, partial [Calocera cornea HHB12733]